MPAGKPPPCRICSTVPAIISMRSVMQMARFVPTPILAGLKLPPFSFRLLKSDIRDKNVTTSNTFEDVQSGQWFNTAVSTMEKLGVVKGRSAGSFDPDAPITRAEFSVICASFDRRQINGGTSFFLIFPAIGRKRVSKEAQRWAGSQVTQTTHSVRITISPVPRP